MKTFTTVTSFLIFIFMMTMTQPTEAQFLKKLGEHAKRKIEQEAERRSKRRVDKKIDETFDEAEDTLDGKKKRRTKRKEQADYENEEQVYEEGEEYTKESTTQIEGGEKKKYTPKVVWSKFDFVPGDKVIFEDGPSPMEENGEFPSRWDLVEGNAEIAEIDGEPAIYMRERYGTIIPYLKNRKEDYLPEVFTIEMDLYFSPGIVYYELYLNDNKNQEEEYNNYISVGPNYVWTEVTDRKYYPGTDDPWLDDDASPIWRHISIAYTRGKFKVYMDDTRLVNIPHYEKSPTGFTLKGNGNGAEGEMRFIKNIRIAKGGVKYYDRVMQDGKIIVNGIRFDVNKTTLKPESMGPINKIYKLMSKKPDLKFSVEGHTDSDGSDANNQSLSEGRAKVVMDKLIEMGISKDRLSSKGWGESKPIAGNDTPEGKANNRRVEFVVIK